MADKAPPHRFSVTQRNRITDFTMAKGISFDMATKDLQCGCGAIIWPLECFAMVFRRTDAHSINHDFRCLKCISAVMIDAAGPPE